MADVHVNDDTVAPSMCFVFIMTTLIAPSTQCLTTFSAIPNVWVDQLYSFSDADLAIYAKPNPIQLSESWSTYYSVVNTKLVFHVHRHKLAAASPVFGEMPHMSTVQDSQSPATSLPGIQLEEQADVVKILLGVIYHDKDRLILPSDMSQNTLLDVWKAAHKYEIPFLAHWALDEMM